MTPPDMAAIHARAMRVPPPWDAATMAGFLSAHGAVFVHHDKGFALGRVIAEEAELLTIAVDPPCQGRGLGRRCLRDFLSACRAAGAERVFLEVAAPNTTARALYGSEGFSEDGLRKGYYRDEASRPIDAILMSKPLAGT